MKVALMTETTYNPFNETHRVSCLRENLTSSSYGEGLETGEEKPQYRASPSPDKWFRIKEASFRAVSSVG